MPSYKSSFGIFFAATAVALTFNSPCHADITVKRGGGEDTTLAAATREVTIFVPVRGLCEILGFNCRWNKTAQKLTCVKEDRKIVFSEDVPFYYVNDSVRQLPCAPVREKAGLLLPAWMAVSVMDGLAAEQVAWNGADTTIIIGERATGEVIASDKTKKEPVKTPVASSTEVKTAQAGDRQLIKTIVIDPGHGGKDPGAIGPDGTKEKDIVLSVGLKVRDMLKKKSDFRCI